MSQLCHSMEQFGQLHCTKMCWKSFAFHTFFSTPTATGCCELILICLTVGLQWLKPTSLLPSLLVWTISKGWKHLHIHCSPWCLASQNIFDLSLALGQKGIFDISFTWPKIGLMRSKDISIHLTSCQKGEHYTTKAGHRRSKFISCSLFSWQGVVPGKENSQ